jgi:hypothetical protein
MHRIIAGVALVTGLAWAAETSQPPDPLQSYLKTDDLDLGKDRTPPKIERIAGGKVRIGPITLDPVAREIVMPGEIATWERNIEVLIASPRGRAYESLLVAPVRPFYFQIALLALGLNPGKPVAAVGEAQAPQGDPMEVYVDYTDPKTQTTKRIRVEEWLWDEQTRKPMRRHLWAFVGSRIVEGRFMGDVLGDLIVTMHHPDAIADSSLTEGTNDYIYNVNDKVCPKPGTKVTIIIKAAKPKAPAASKP